MMLEELYGPFVFFGRAPRHKRAKVAALARARVLLAGIKPILAGFEFANHGISSVSEVKEMQPTCQKV
jgi:hypothetical protein